jgi:flagellin
VTAAATAVNTSQYNATQAFTAETGTDTFTITDANGKAVEVNLTSANAGTLAAAVNAINSALQAAGSSVSAVATGDNSTGISFQSSSNFSLVVSAAGDIFAATGNQTVTAATTGGTAGTDATAAIDAINAAIKTLGLVQGKVGAGENKLQYAISLAQSQISSFSAAESQIRDADVAAAAANLTKAQVLTQTSIAALAQANSEPQSVLKLLQG